MPFSTPLRPFLLACSLALLLPGCGMVERIDANGNPINKPGNKPVVGTHVTPGASPAAKPGASPAAKPGASPAAKPAASPAPR